MTESQMPIPQQPGPHELKYLAQELGQAVRALIERHDILREQLFMAAKQAKQQTKAKRATPKCGAKKASGGRCSTRLQPGQFRCDLHAAEMRRRRDANPNPNQGGKRTRQQDASKASNGADSDAEACTAPAAGPASIVPVVGGDGRAVEVSRSVT